jgi:hypothetical protein
MKSQLVYNLLVAIAIIATCFVIIDLDNDQSKTDIQCKHLQAQLSMVETAVLCDNCKDYIYDIVNQENVTAEHLVYIVERQTETCLVNSHKVLKYIDEH